MTSKDLTAAKAIPKILDKYRASLMAGDPDQWISNWTEDCIQLPPGGPMKIGKQILYESIVSWLNAHNVSDFKIWDLGIEENGNWAFSWLNYSYHLTPKDGNPAYIYKAKALTIYQRQPDGTWKIHRDCFNANTPN